MPPPPPLVLQLKRKSSSWLALGCKLIKPQEHTISSVSQFSFFFFPHVRYSTPFIVSYESIFPRFFLFPLTDKGAIKLGAGDGDDAARIGS